MSGRPGWRKRSAARAARVGPPARILLTLAVVDVVAALLGGKGPIASALEPPAPPAPAPEKRTVRDLGAADVVD